FAFACASVLAFVAAPRAAQAQSTALTPTIGPPRVKWLFGADPNASDANGSAGNAPLGDAMFAPLRLTLLSLVPARGMSDPACSESIESTGNATATTNGAPAQYAAAIRLVPHLTLAGFARNGCARDGAAGGGLVFTQRIAQKIWFVGSAGTVVAPHYYAP